MGYCIGVVVVPVAIVIIAGALCWIWDTPPSYLEGEFKWDEEGGWEWYCAAWFWLSRIEDCNCSDKFNQGIRGYLHTHFLCDGPPTVISSPIYTYIKLLTCATSPQQTENTKWTSFGALKIYLTTYGINKRWSGENLYSVRTIKYKIKDSTDPTCCCAGFGEVWTWIGGCTRELTDDESNSQDPE